MSILRRDIGLALIIISLSIAGFFSANSFADESNFYGPAFFPRLIFILLIIFSLLMVIESVFKRRIHQGQNGLSKELLIKSFLMILTILVYIFLFNNIGFIMSSILFLIVSQIIFNVKNKIVLIIVSIVIPILLSFIFSNLFNIPLP